MLHTNVRIVLSVTLLHSYFLSSALPSKHALKRTSSPDKSDLDFHLSQDNPEAALEYYKQFLQSYDGQHDFDEDNFDHHSQQTQADDSSDDYDSYAAHYPVVPESFPTCMSIEYLTELKDRFTSQIDHNDDGKATYEEMLGHLRDYNPRVRNSTVRKFMNRRDLNGNGVIEFVPEYIRNIVVPDHSEENAREWFSLDDTDANGYVTRGELLAITRHLGTPPNQAQQQVSSYYMSNDKDGDDRLSWDEYKSIYGQ